MKVILDAELVEKRDGSIVLLLKTGHGDPKVWVDARRVKFADEVGADDLTRLPLLMAAAMTRQLEANRHKGGRENWLSDGPKALLKRLEEEVAELKEAIRLHPDRVLTEAADVCNFALMVADKADKLEPAVPIEAGDC